MKDIYVGNLSFRTSEDELRDLFEQYGTVQRAAIVTDRETGRSRGFGFVEMDDAGAAKAIESLDGYEFGGRRLHVNESRGKQKGGDR